MIDNCGNWIAENDYSVYPKDKWCDYDYVACWINSLGYKPNTSIENLVSMIVLYYDTYLEDNDADFYLDMIESENDLMISIKDISAFVEDGGGLKEFDY